MDYVNEAQIELGDRPTSYEPYVGDKGIAHDNGELPVIINSHKGVNTIWAIDEGNTDLPVNITVTGKADPVSVIENLTNAIISLGGNV